MFIKYKRILKLVPLPMLDCVLIRSVAVAVAACCP
jgi:hypothetical protein